MTDVEIAIGLMDWSRRRKSRDWMRAKRASDPALREKERQQQRARSARLRTVAFLADMDLDGTVERLRALNADKAFAARMNGLRFEDQPGAY